MKKTLGIVSLLIVTTVAFSKEYVIDDYSFTWTVAESASTSLLIEKTQDKLRVILRKKTGISFESIYLSPQEAKEVGIALGRANEFFNKQKDSKTDTSEVVKTGNYAVTFQISQKSGFLAIVRPTERFALDALVLDRKEASTMSEQLQDIQEKASFLANAIKF